MSENFSEKAIKQIWHRQSDYTKKFKTHSFELETKTAFNAGFLILSLAKFSIALEVMKITNLLNGVYKIDAKFDKFTQNFTLKRDFF